METYLYAPAFERFITLLIILNAITLGCLTYSYQDHGPDSPLVQRLLAFDMAIICVFVVEIVLKIYAQGFRFFRSGWNIFDFLIVSLGFLGGSYPLTVVRSLRILRTLRIVRHVPSMKVIIESFLRALPGIGSVIMVMMLLIFIFAVIGTSLFAPVSPEYFGDLQSSAFTLFTVLTLEGWPDIAREVMPIIPGSWIFFVSYIGINSLVILNLMIAVIIQSMQKEYDEHAEEEREDILAEVRAISARLERMANSPTNK